MRFIPPLVAAALAAAAQQPVDEARLASARAAHAATDQLNEAVDALEQRQRARAHERRRLEQRKNEGAAHAAAISNKTEALWAELTKTKDLGDGRGPCDLASAGPDALTWARDALKDAAAVSKRLQGDRKAYLEAAQADLELLNRTVYPSLRAERDAIDLNLNDARARQKVLREDHAKSKTAWLRDQAMSFPLSLARSGAANWTAFRGAFNACAPILYGCRCHDDYDLFLYLCPVFFVPSCSLASGGLSRGVLVRPPAPRSYGKATNTPDDAIDANRTQVPRRAHGGAGLALAPRPRGRARALRGLGDRRAEPEQGPGDRPRERVLRRQALVDRPGRRALRLARAGPRELQEGRVRDPELPGAVAVPLEDVAVCLGGEARLAGAGVAVAGRFLCVGGGGAGARAGAVGGPEGDAADRGGGVCLSLCFLLVLLLSQTTRACCTRTHIARAPRHRD